MRISSCFEQQLGVSCILRIRCHMEWRHSIVIPDIWISPRVDECFERPRVGVGCSEMERG